MKNATFAIIPAVLTFVTVFAPFMPANSQEYNYAQSNSQQQIKNANQPSGICWVLGRRIPC